jgi:hypothetical protein
MGERRFVYRIFMGRLREGDHLEDPGLDWRILLKIDLREVGWGHGLD